MMNQANLILSYKMKKKKQIRTFKWWKIELGMIWVISHSKSIISFQTQLKMGYYKEKFSHHSHFNITVKLLVKRKKATQLGHQYSKMSRNQVNSIQFIIMSENSNIHKLRRLNFLNSTIPRTNKITKSENTVKADKINATIQKTFWARIALEQVRLQMPTNKNLLSFRRLIFSGAKKFDLRKRILLYSAIR